MSEFSSKGETRKHVVSIRNWKIVSCAQDHSSPLLHFSDSPLLFWSWRKRLTDLNDSQVTELWSTVPLVLMEALLQIVHTESLLFLSRMKVPGPWCCAHTMSSFRATQAVLLLDPVPDQYRTPCEQQRELWHLKNKEHSFCVVVVVVVVADNNRLSLWKLFGNK